jgi:hypothetical protein
MLLVGACSGPKPQDQRLKLRSELLKWESFDGQGIVEISYMGLSLRKMFNVQKNKGVIRLDVFDGGIMGAGAQPLVSIFVGDYLAFQSVLPLLDSFDPFGTMPLEGLDIFANADSMLARYGNQIIDNKALTEDNLQVQFDKGYHLQRLYIPESNTELLASYSNKGSLQVITMRGMENMAVKLIFDSISYTPPQIVSLPKPTKPANTLPTDIKELDMKNMLKDYIKN